MTNSIIVCLSPAFFDLAEVSGNVKTAELQKYQFRSDSGNLAEVSVRMDRTPAKRISQHTSSAERELTQVLGSS